MKKVLLFSAGILLYSLSYSQVGEVMNTESGVIVCDYFAITRPLREIAAEEEPMSKRELRELQREHIEESKDREKREPQKFLFTPEKDGPAYGNDPSLIQGEQGQTPAKAPIMNFAGQTATGFRPMDPSGAAGGTYYMQAINSTTYRIYNKTTGATVLSGTVGSLWSPATSNDGDPIILYDRYADRWFVSQFGISGNRIYIAISTTNDPTGSYYTYSFTSPQFPDYLKFAVWQDGYYMTSNQGTQKVFAFQRSAMLTGSPTAKVVYTNFSPPTGGGFYCPMPGDSDGNGGLAPAGTPCPIFLYTDNAWGGGVADAIRVYTMSVNWVPATPTASITLAATLNTSAFDASYDPSWNDISQPGTTQKLDGIGGVLQYRAQWRNWSTYRTTVVTWPVRISATQRSLMWAEVRQNATTGVWSLYQQSIYAPDTKSRWLGSIAMDDNGGIGLCYARVSTTAGDFMSLYYAGRKVCDPLNTLPVAEQLAIAGTGSQTGGVNRVGDYAQTSLDPDGVTLWYTGEYMGGPTGGSAARTRVYSFQLPTCAAVAPVAGFTGSPTTVCAGQTVTFTDGSTNSPTSWSWTFPGGTPGTSTLQNPTVTYNTPGTYNVSLTATNAAGSNSVTQTGYVVVNAIPATPTVSSSSPDCTGQTISLTTPTVAGATYSWTGPSSFTSALQNPTRPSATAAMAGTYSVTVTVAGCTSLAGTTAVVINTTPATPTASSTGPYCAGSTINLSTPTVAGATYSWTGPGGYTSTLQNPTRPSSTTAMSGTYSVTVTSSAGCTSAAGTTTLTVNAIPATPTVSSSSPDCTGQTISLTTPTVAGATYSWTGPSSFSSTLQNPTRPSATTAMAGTYSVTVTVGGCTSLAGTTAVVVNTSPSVNAELNQAYCPGASVPANTFTSTPAGATYTWTNSNTAIGLAASGTTSVPVFTATNATGSAINATITVTPTAGGCTGTPLTYTITVNPNPSMTAPSNATYCNGDPVAASTLSSTPAGATYSWTNSNTAIGLAASGTGNIPAFTATNAGASAISGTVTITPTLAGCNGTAVTYTITVNPTPATPTISQVGLTLTSSSPTGNQWYLNGVLIPGATNQNYTVTSNGNYTVVVTAAGCSSSASAVTSVINVGIEDASNVFGLMVYPNPNDGNFNVSFNAMAKSDYTIELHNALGQIVYREELKAHSGSYSKKFNVVEYGKGTYTITLTNSENETVKRIIVY